MATSSVGSDAFALIALAVISTIVLLLLRHYLPIRSTPAYLLVPIFLALALPASIILLVPIDLASSSGDEDGDSRGIWLPQNVMLVVWRICYWLTFALTWVILPILGEYADSGYREPRNRFLYSLRSNGRYQLIMLVSGIAGLIYFFITSGVHITSLKALVMALAYAWGLVLAVYLMGHGLVALPRRLIKNANVSGRLKRLQAHAVVVYDGMTDAMEDLHQLESQLLQLRQKRNGASTTLREWIDELVDISTLPESRLPAAPPTRTATPNIPTIITERYLADLTRKLKRARHKRARFVQEWDYLVQEAWDLQAILDASRSGRLEFGKASPRYSLLSKVPILNPSTRYQLYARVIPFMRYVLGAASALASTCIVWSEVAKSITPKLSIIAYTVVHHPNSNKGQIGFAGQCIAGAWLLYMCFAALVSISEVKVWGNRALVRRNTYPESACWYAYQVAKLTVPLSYNFITFMQPKVFQATTFYQFLGRLINLTPLGSGFSRFFPIFILFPVCATSFNLYGKLQSLLGFGVIEDEDGEDPSGSSNGGWREGRALIERETHGRNTLGLLSRAELTSPSASGASTPTRAGANGNTNQAVNQNPPNAATNSASNLPTRRQPLTSEDLPPDEEGSFFENFAHRLRNTFESRNNLGGGFKKPKWMGGTNGSREGSSTDSGGALGKLFAGRSGDGRVRL